jgi:hypothetical protein
MLALKADEHRRDSSAFVGAPEAGKQQDSGELDAGGRLPAGQRSEILAVLGENEPSFAGGVIEPGLVRPTEMTQIPGAGHVDCGLSWRVAVAVRGDSCASR